MDIGRIKIMTSVKMCMPALAYQTGPTGRQCLSWARLPDQNRLTGTQNAKLLMTIHSPEMMRKVIRI